MPRPNPPSFNAALEPLAGPLPPRTAAAIGRTIARHSQLGWVLGQVLYGLMEISIKQGRAVVRRPPPRQFLAAIQGLYAYHRLEAKLDFDRLARALERADAARDTLVRSVYLRVTSRRGSPIFLVRGPWAEGEDLEATRRGDWPQTPVLDDALLARLEGEVEAAMRGAERLQQTTDRLLRRLHEARRTNPRLNRRQRQ